METDRTVGSRTEALWATSALHQARYSRWHLLRGAQRLCLAHAPARSAAVADCLLLLHGVAARGTLAEDSRHAARCGEDPERKKKPRVLRSSTLRVLKYLTTEECAATMRARRSWDESDISWWIRWA